MFYYSPKREKYDRMSESLSCKLFDFRSVCCMLKQSCLVVVIEDQRTAFRRYLKGYSSVVIKISLVSTFEQKKNDSYRPFLWKVTPLQNSIEKLHKNFMKLFIKVFQQFGTDPIKARRFPIFQVMNHGSDFLNRDWAIYFTVNMSVSMSNNGSCESSS